MKVQPTELRFRLSHFWEARNIAKGGTCMGLEMLLIGEQNQEEMRLDYLCEELISDNRLSSESW
ncbi:hypothetical protein Bca52824_036159 [Brassica carinata]|uniref:Uncharacterized protein n=1 Tax=Brassica carinata TaxID=52824 RepID=A0A8X7V2G8_BRACI|nr:hypothetical protein Bca52824_036159 [Brassica carinata]